MQKWLRRARYRLGQTCQQLGSARPLTEEEDAEVARRLPPPALTLFNTMATADKRHALRVYRGLQKRGCSEEDMLAAALLHDVGKAWGRVPFWTRPAVVLGRRLLPALLRRLVVYPAALDTPARAPLDWRRALSYAWFHAEVGAQLAAAAGMPERVVVYIRTHHQPHGPAAELHEVDEVS
jgi:hypothetical protein